MKTTEQVNSPLTRLFPLFSNRPVNMKREILAGVTTFLTMAYIIAVNPNILSATGMPAGALVTATCLSAALGCFIMGLIADLPFALASGMGLNAFFAFTVVIGMKVPWEIALTAVFVEGIIFIILTLFKVREAVVNSIPVNMKLAVTGGIGLFIAMIGLSGSGIIVANESTLVALGEFTPAAIVACVGLVLIAVLDKRGVKGAILIGIVVSSLLAWGYAMINPAHARELGIFLPEGLFKFESMAPIAGKVDFSYMTHPANLGAFIGIVCTFLFVDFFDTAGTLVAVGNEIGLVNEKGELENAEQALLADSIGTCVGAALGTSTVTSFVESSSGVGVGGRTGLTAITTGVFFILSIFISPLVLGLITNAVTAPALIVVGVMMAQQMKNVKWDDITIAIPAFVTIISMILMYSISNGIAFGFISYVVVMLAAGRAKEIHPTVWVLMVIFLFYFASPYLSF